MKATRDNPTKRRKGERERQKAYDVTYTEIKNFTSFGYYLEKIMLDWLVFLL